MIIREGLKEDLQQVLQLIKELAAYEKALDEVSNTVEMMEKDGFGKDPIFGFFVAEVEGKIVGLALYYYRYSTWKGRRLYLEDIVVTEKERGKGLGKKLFNECIEKALNENCTGMMWQVLDWNQPAIDFYTKKYEANLDGEWINCSLSKEQLERHLATK